MTLQLQFKTENQIFCDFINVTKQAFELFNIQNWQIKQLKQVFKTNILSPAVFISILEQPQNGSQQFTDKKINGIAVRKNIVKQETTIRFSATRRELQADTVQTYNGADILKLIKGYLQTIEGINYLKQLGYAQYRASAINTMEFINDSDNFQLMPYFDIQLIYSNSWTEEVKEITKTTFSIYKI